MGVQAFGGLAILQVLGEDQKKVEGQKNVLPHRRPHLGGYVLPASPLVTSGPVYPKKDPNFSCFLILTSNRKA